jgi:hypothetical protein
MDAAPQTVWSILDDIARYPEWNSLVRELHGLTIMGETVTGRMVLQNTPEIQLEPVLTRIVGGRELRWITTVPGEKGFTAEHYFILTPTANGGTHLPLVGERPDDRYQIIAGGTNISDDRYIVTGLNQQGTGAIYGTYNPPAEWYASFRMKFN